MNLFPIQLGWKLHWFRTLHFTSPSLLHTPTVGYDWSTDRLKSDWLKSTSDSLGRSSLPGKSQKIHTHTHPRPFTHSQPMIHSWFLNIQRFCTQLYICELRFAFVKRILWIYIFLFCIACELFFVNIYILCTWIVSHACELGCGCVHLVFCVNY